MKNLKSIIHYECATSFKYIWLFYAIQYALVGFITMIVGLVMGTFEEVRNKTGFRNEISLWVLRQLF